MLCYCKCGRALPIKEFSLKVKRGKVCCTVDALCKDLVLIVIVAAICFSAFAMSAAWTCAANSIPFSMARQAWQYYQNNRCSLPGVAVPESLATFFQYHAKRVRIVSTTAVSGLH